MEMMLWNAILTGVVLVLAGMVKSKMEELNRLGILLNRTREEVARDHITRKEVDDKIDRLITHVDGRFNRLEAKIDELRVEE
jgi:hypothetical protein